MPKYRITSPDGQSYDVTAPDGATEDEVLAYAQRNFKMAKAPAAEKPSKPFGQQLNEGIADIPRQLGLTARAGLQGIGNVADLIATPARAALNLLPGVNIRPGVGQNAANMLGLPQPQNATERIVGDAASALAGGVVPIAAGASLARDASGAAQGVGRLLASNPGGQLASAGASGAAGGYTRETGGDDMSQILASLAAGVAAPAALAGAQRAGAAGARALTGRGAAVQPVQVDVTINNALQDSGLTLDQLPSDVARGIRSDVAAAMKTSNNLSVDAVRRLADYRLTGLTPTQARLSQDVGDITRQSNLSKLGANLSDPQAQALAQTQNQNNRALTAGLNQLGANTTDDAVSAGQRIMGSLSARDSRARDLINQRYDAARATSGRSAALDPQAFASRANQLLDENLLGGKVPADVRNLLDRKWTNVVSDGMPAQSGQATVPPASFTVDTAEQIKTRLAALQRSSADPAERKALGLVRSALDDAPLLPGQEIGQEAIDAFAQARNLNRKWAGIVERTPALQAVRDGAEPDKFVEQFIIGRGNNANTMDVAKLKSSIKADPEAMQAVREQILSHLKTKALSGAEDEVGNFSQSAYNKALKAVGERKLSLFFNKEDINQLKALGRVASYEQSQPVGAAVNNSNTAGAVGGVLERIGGSSLLGRIPFGRQAIGDPLQNISVGIRAGRAMDAPRSLIAGPGVSQRMPQLGSLRASPLIGQQQETEQERLQRRVRELMNQ